MEITSLIAILLAFITGLLISYLYAKSKFNPSEIQHEFDKEKALTGAKTAALEKDLEEKKLLIENLNSEIRRYSETEKGDKGKIASLETTVKRIDELSADLVNKERMINAYLEDINQKTGRIAELETRISEEKKLTEEKLRLLNDAKEKFTIEFQNLANQIFDDKSAKFQDINKNGIESLLNPFKEQLGELKKKVEESYTDDAKDRSQIMTLINQLKEQNQKLSEDALNLTKALKGESKTMGMWGEMILEKVFESSGLVKDREYIVQKSFFNSRGERFMPDAVVKLPDSKDIIIDSKVSLVDYEKYFNADDPAEKDLHLKNHIGSVRRHIAGLSSKDYTDLTGINTVDYVLMFIPVEAAFHAVISLDKEIYNEAFSKKVVLVAPSTLLVTLKTIHLSWQSEKRNRSAQEIADTASEMLDKFKGFLDSFEDIGKSISKAHQSYEKAKGQLSDGRGNLMSKAQKLLDMGVKSKLEITDSGNSE